MKHPSNRAERRLARDRIISIRRFIYEHIWNHQFIQFNFLKEVVNPCISVDYIFDRLQNDRRLDEVEKWEIHWGIYSKWNFTCDPYHCRLCNWTKTDRRRKNKQRRIALKKAGENWEELNEAVYCTKKGWR